VIISLGKTIIAFCGLIISWMGIGKGFWRRRWDQVP